ncbi:phosphoketolase [Methylobacterium goesingense]|uniref:Xylulose-5-phosphate/fructose-6-phosphate phosphoketolase n=1 Tax=Methylobacterium goesingense TaxID=243690 RepID=A0ABV2L2Y7_9HYPH|nr:phosphoketolase [Methylobacterium goesingense]
MPVASDPRPAVVQDHGGRPFRLDVVPGPLGPTGLTAIDARWRAENDLSVGQIVLLDNPLLREPLSLGQMKPRPIGHWGTTPGLNFLSARFRRALRLQLIRG